LKKSILFGGSWNRGSSPSGKKLQFFVLGINQLPSFSFEERKFGLKK
jgi:hypothetical protein